MWEKAVVKGVWYYVRGNQILGAVMLNDYFIRGYVHGKEVWNVTWNSETKAHFVWHIDTTFTVVEKGINS